MSRFYTAFPKFSLCVLASVLFTSLATAQRGDHYYLNPNIPYIEQRGFSLGANFGVADMWADVGTKSIIDHYNNKIYFDDIRFMGGVFMRYTQFPGLSYRLGLNFGQLYATDAWNKDKALKAATTEDDAFQRYTRNLNVRTNIWEANLIAEIAPLRFTANWEDSRMSQWKLQPYFLVGVAGFRYNPQGLHKDFINETEEWVDLRPLRTEGQGYTTAGLPDFYSKYSYAVIAGFGIKRDIARSFGLGIEYQMRITFTDYLDDASGKYLDPLYHQIAGLEGTNRATKLAIDMADKTYEIIPGLKHEPGTYRGDPNNKDMYGTLNLVFYWKIDKLALPWWKTYR